MPRLRFTSSSLDAFRRQLAGVDALPQLCLLGALAGLITGGLMVAFRQLMSLGAMAFLPGGSPEAFEQLPPLARSLLPLLAVGLIGLWMWRQPPTGRSIGVAHVIERLSYHQGRFPLRNWLTQWWVGLVSVLGGLSAGREGPAIHLGAAAASGVGERLKLPHNSLRVLAACGVAAGIAASFNTPIAGVIFAMEVVMMEYTITGFMPVILASSLSALVAQLVYGSEPAFPIPGLNLKSLMDIPWIVVSALLIGLLAGLFVRIGKLGPHLKVIPVWWRYLIVAASVGITAWWYPQVQGMGYDILGQTLTDQVAVDVLAAVVIGKLVLTAGTVAMGIPVSIIGPILVIGGAAGTLCGLLGMVLMPETASSPELYTMLGMAAMMGAVLQAPLAALMALLELTHNPNIIMPGMLSVVVAGLTARQLCRCQGFFITVAGQHLNQVQHSLQRALARVSVQAVMERNIKATYRRIRREEAKKLLEGEPIWIVILRSSDDKPTLALKGADLVKVLFDEELAAEEEIDLLDIPGQRLDVAAIPIRATLGEALNRLEEATLDALFVEASFGPPEQRIFGIITREAIENYYRYKS
ncbi:chloride channel protein [Pistricoccus aurantiacus]|uniref:chloride channel protein n=1 Tax=Pistricoccus aurantiacus TaxID=1883414 RepID=UPI001FE4A4F2|nr:chloride channel protein [Pistricoccus aurantiacus]